MTARLRLSGGLGERRRQAIPLATLALAANRAIVPSTPILPRALLDESAHLATTALVAEAFGVRDSRLLRSALYAAVLIDVDHVPGAVFGWTALSSGAPRPYTHSLTTLAAVLALARSPWVRDRRALEGLAFGVATHFLRDATDGTDGLPLLWPIASRGFRLPAWLNTMTVLGTMCWIQHRPRPL